MISERRRQGAFPFNGGHVFLDSELVFSGELVTALTILFAVCILLPTMYYVWYVYRKRFNHIALLGGLAAFFLFGFLVAENLLRLLPSAEGAGRWTYALLRAVVAALCDVGGYALGLWFLKKQHGTIRVPISFGLGYRLFEMLYLGALNTLLRLTSAMTVNRDGIQALLDTVTEEQAPALRLQLMTLAESSPGMYWMSTVDYICRFVLTVALVRMIWYAFEGGRERSDPRLIAAAFGVDLLCELMLALHAAGASYRVCAGIYYVLVAGAVCLAYYTARRRDDPQKIAADHLTGRNIRRRKY